MRVKTYFNFIGKKPDLGKIDFLLAHRKYALAMLSRAKNQAVLDGKFSLKIIDTEDLIGLKLQSSINDPARYYQDMADIISLIRENYDKIDMELIREYFEVFDKQDELDKITKEMQNV